MIWILLAFAGFYAIKAATAKTQEEQDKANKSAKNNLVAAGVVFGIVVLLLIAAGAA